MTAITPLAATQHAFCAWLTEPDEDRASALARGLNLGPALVVYQNNYRVALIEALRETCSRAVLWLGNAAFEAAAARYIDACPPSSWTIDAYGADFADSLRSTDAVAADLAAIDRAVGNAFVAADAVTADADSLADVDWEVAVIRHVPSLEALEIATNADAIWLALVAEETVPHAATTPGTVMIWRQGFEPVMRRADPLECAILCRSREGVAFATICEDMAAADNAEEAVTRAGTVLGQWLGEGLIIGFS